MWWGEGGYLKIWQRWQCRNSSLPVFHPVPFMTATDDSLVPATNSMQKWKQLLTILANKALTHCYIPQLRDLLRLAKISLIFKIFPVTSKLPPPVSRHDRRSFQKKLFDASNKVLHMYLNGNMQNKNPRLRKVFYILQMRKKAIKMFLIYVNTFQKILNITFWNVLQRVFSLSYFSNYNLTEKWYPADFQNYAQKQGPPISCLL